MATRPYEDYFDLQLRFAAHYARLARVPAREAIARCTNFRRRFGLAGACGAAAWENFLRQLPEGAEPAVLLARAMDFLQGCRTVEPSQRTFGCFSYDPPDAWGTLRIHFMPRDVKGSPFGRAHVAERRAELRCLFAHVRQHHPQTARVQGVSWLYNLDAYKRLFPPEYGAAAMLPEFPLHLNGSSTWGQVLDWRQAVKPQMRDLLLARLGRMTVDAPWAVFPLPALTTCCDVVLFYEWFG